MENSVDHNPVQFITERCFILNTVFLYTLYTNKNITRYPVKFLGIIKSKDICQGVMAQIFDVQLKKVSIITEHKINSPEVFAFLVEAIFYPMPDLVLILE
jgi:hypothetical protein